MTAICANCGNAAKCSCGKPCDWCLEPGETLARSGATSNDHADLAPLRVKHCCMSCALYSYPNIKLIT